MRSLKLPNSAWRRDCQKIALLMRKSVYAVLKGRGKSSGNCLAKKLKAKAKSHSKKESHKQIEASLRKPCRESHSPEISQVNSRLFNTRAPRFVWFELALHFCQSPWWVWVWLLLYNMLFKNRRRTSLPREKGNHLKVVLEGATFLFWSCYCSKHHGALTDAFKTSL